MKIKDLSCVELSSERSLPNGRAITLQRTLVRVASDEGLEGFALQRGGAGRLISGRLKPHVLGEDVYAIERIWERLYAETSSLQERAVVEAISTLDLALWDLIGKSTGMPIYQLLGGYRSRVPAYADGDWDPEVEPPEETFSRYVKEGFKAVKIHLHREELEDLERCEALIKRLREALGEDVGLMVDASRSWSPLRAIEAAKRLERYGIFWLEEPVLFDDYIYGCATVRSATTIRIASGETAHSGRICRDLIEKGAVDVLQFDPHLGGGLTPWRKVAGMAELYHIPMAPHGARWPETNSQLVAAYPNCLMVPEFPLLCPICGLYRWPELYVDPVEAEEGYITLPDKPGFGVELRESKIEEFTDGCF